MLKFKAGHKEHESAWKSAGLSGAQRGHDDCAIIWFLHRYEFNCESQHERTLLALGLRAATARLAKHPSMVGKGGLLRLAVPAKPLGFLNAALTERNVAFPEPFRSRILPESKALVEQTESQGRRMSAGLHKEEGSPPAADAGDASPATTPCTCEVA